MHKRFEKVTLWVAVNDVGGDYQPEALDYVVPLLEDHCEVMLIEYESELWTMVKDDSPEPITWSALEQKDSAPAKKTKKKVSI